MIASMRLLLHYILDSLVYIIVNDIQFHKIKTSWFILLSPITYLYIDIGTYVFIIIIYSPYDITIPSIIH